MARDALRDAFFEQMHDELLRFVDPATGKARADLVEHIPCPLCAGTVYNVLFTKLGLDFVRCGKCSFVYVNPRLKEDVVIKGYTGDAEAESNRIWKKVLESPEQQAFNTVAFDRLLDQLGGAGRVLDVGCSVGHFLLRAQARGYEVEGLEIEPEALAAARAAGLTVHEATLEEKQYPDASFDVVALLGLIEHVPNPRGLLREVHRILRPGGAVVFNGVPNVESLMVMVLREEARTFNGRNHLGYYSPRTLQYVLDAEHFALSWLETYVAGLDAVVNCGMFMPPFGDVPEALPEPIKALLTTGRSEAEEWICRHGLGYKIRAVARKQSA